MPESAASAVSDKGFDARQLRQLVRWLSAARIDSFELETTGYRLRIVAAPDLAASHASAAATVTPACGRAVVRAGARGQFLPRHPLADADFVQPGDTVRPGAVLGLIRQKVLLLPVIARCRGHLLERLAEPGAPVTPQTALFRLALDPQAASPFDVNRFDLVRSPPFKEQAI